MKIVSLKESILELFAQEEKEASNQEEEVSSEPENVTLTPQDEEILRRMEQGIEREINNSVNSDPEEISEAAAEGGFAYEGTVLAAIRKAGLTGNIKKGAGADSSSADADIKINGQVYNIEVKLDKNAQMGGSSVRFGNQGIQLVNQMEKGTREVLMAAVSSKAADLNQLLGYIAKQRPKAVNGKVDKFPLACSKDAWERATSKGLLVNTKLRYKADFIAKHYAKKGIYYIQIGKSGLFYMAGNPANLPIPKLTGEIDIEIRSARSGSRPLASGVLVVAGGIRVQARLKTKGQSPYTADDPKSLLAMLAAMKAGVNPKSKNPPAPTPTKPRAPKKANE